MKAENEDPRGTGSVTPRPTGISTATEVVTRVENFCLCRRRSLMQVGNRVEKPLNSIQRATETKRVVGVFVSVTCENSFAPACPQISFMMFLSKWLPVGKQVHRYNPAVYPSQCPSCSCENDDFNHAFRCPDPQRHKWRSDLRRELLQRLHYLNTDPVLADLIIDGLYHWLLNSPPTSPTVPTIPPPS
jgi:hypothetical protein